MKANDFFNRMPCIVDMDSMNVEGEKICEDDKIVRIELIKETYSYYTVYYYHRIYNDDRIYKCKIRLKALPKMLQDWKYARAPRENQFMVVWEGAEYESPNRLHKMS